MWIIVELVADSLQILEIPPKVVWASLEAE